MIYIKLFHFVIFVYSTILDLNRYITFFCLLLGTNHFYGQDIHFSQYSGSLLNISPGYTGMFNGDYRLSAIYRSQWQSVPVSYSTFNMNGELRVKPKKLNKDMLGFGLMFNNDKAGDTYYGSNQIYLNGTYIYLAKPDSSLIITLGLNMGYCQVGFDYTKMTFNNQFDGFKFNNSSSSGEKFYWTSSKFVDVNFGSAIQYIFNKKNKLIYGLGLHHVNTPKISFQGNDLSQLNFKFTNCLSFSRPLTIKTDLIAEALITLQGNNYEVIPHASIKYHMLGNYNKSILGGFCWRARDAVIVRFGYHYKTMQSGISYDINTSDFNVATNRRGSLEIFINYIFSSKTNFTPKKRTCPVFM